MGRLLMNPDEMSQLPPFSCKMLDYNMTFSRGMSRGKSPNKNERPLSKKVNQTIYKDKNQPSLNEIVYKKLQQNIKNYEEHQKQ